MVVAVVSRLAWSADQSSQQSPQLSLWFRNVGGKERKRERGVSYGESNKAVDIFLTKTGEKLICVILFCS